MLLMPFLVAFLACSEKEVIKQDFNESISFTPLMHSSTRATAVTTNDLEKFSVQAWELSSKPQEGVESVCKKKYFNTIVSKISDTWHTQGTYYWSTKPLGFFAYANIEDPINSNPTNLTKLQFKDFQPAKKIEDQKDVIVAYNQGIADDFNAGISSVPMFFKHILSQVEVQAYCANPNIKIDVKGLKICKVAGKADFTLPAMTTNESKEISSNWSTKNKEWAEIDKDVYSTKHESAKTLSWDETKMTSLMGDKGSFMLIPSQLTPWKIDEDKENNNEGAYISILCKITSRPNPSTEVSSNPSVDFAKGTQLYPEGKDGCYAYSAVPIKTKWEPGKKYIYKLEFCAKGGGAGYVDPEPTDPNNPDDPEIKPDDKSKGDPVLGGEIKFVKVEVQPWDKTEVKVPKVRYVPQMEVSEDKTYFSHQGGTKEVTIKSVYDVHGENDNFIHTKPLAWEATFYNDDREEIEKPDWLEFETNGDGGENQKLKIIVHPQTNKKELNSFNKELRKVQVKTRANDLVQDLSNGGETANCYIVNAPGYYKLPLIIGNGRKGGKLQDHTRLSDTFVNYKGEKISKVGYKINNAVEATLVWQDVDNLVSNVKLSGVTEPSGASDLSDASDAYDVETGVRFLEFYVDPATILTGNAVVAVKDVSGDIIWSWHIWVTNYHLGEDITLKNNDDEDVSVMPLNLGWAECQEAEYEERHVDILLSSYNFDEENYEHEDENEDGNHDAWVAVKQIKKTIYSGGRNAYYQWGRKDPMLPAIVVDGVVNDFNQDFDEEKLKFTIEEGQVTMQTAIKNPNVFYKNEHNWCSNIYTELWNYKAEEKNPSSIGKTIYDPCPAGYHMPTVNSFKLFTSSETDNNYWNEGVKDKYHSSSCGVKRGELYFPAVGCRRNTDGMSYYYNKNFEGTYWLSTLNDKKEQTAKFLNFSKDLIKNLDNEGFQSSYGYSVRPVRDINEE